MIQASAAGGDRNSNFTLEYKAHRLFGTYLSLSANTFFRTYNTYLYADDPAVDAGRATRSGFSHCPTANNLSAIQRHL